MAELWMVKSLDGSVRPLHEEDAEFLKVFKPGEPVKRAPELHLGFQVPSNAKLADWAGKFGATITKGEEFNTFQVSDPEDNCLEIYCDRNS